jgi:hypothetical protein
MPRRSPAADDLAVEIDRGAVGVGDLDAALDAGDGVGRDLRLDAGGAHRRGGVGERPVAGDLQPDVAKARTVGAMQAERMVIAAAGEIALAVAGLVRDRQPKHVVEVVLHLVVLDGVEREKTELRHFDRHDDVFQLERSCGPHGTHWRAHQQADPAALRAAAATATLESRPVSFPPATAGDILSA